MKTATVELVASAKWTGSYGNTAAARLVIRNGSLFLVIDQWCGGDMEGLCYREHAYMVPDNMREVVAYSLRNPDENIGHWTRIEYLEKVLLADMRPLGRIGQLPWTNEL